MRTSYKTLADEEYNVLEKIAHETKMDCWFFIKQDNKGVDYIYDLENRKRMCLRTGVCNLIDGIDCVENYNSCNLTIEESNVFHELLKKLKIDFEY